MLKSIVFLTLVVLAYAKEESQCIAKHNVVKEDWKTLNADTSKPAEKMLCVFKCMYEENGSINSEGVLNVEKLIENVNKWKYLSDSSKSSIRECVKDLGPVKTCPDINPSFQCVHKALAKQGKEESQCIKKHKVEEEDWKTLNADTTKPNEKMLCLFKCMYEENGTINSEGVLDVEKLIENTHKWKSLTDASKSSIRECAKSLGPVKTCADVDPSFQCVHKALAKQKQGTA